VSAFRRTVGEAFKRTGERTLTFDTLRSTFGGSAFVRVGEAADAIDGVVPGAIVEPESAETLAALLAWASREAASVVLSGRGTRLAWGRWPGAIDLVISTRRLNRVLAHSHGDLTATVEAGATIRDVNRELMRRRQWLPIDVVDDDATIGGAIATNDSGPLRHRHGTPRDQLIGIHLAMTDGRVVKAGGNVVKNVAGYDLGKLVSGSFGGLAAIATATFKLAPLPTASATVVATFRDADATARAAGAISESQLDPAAFEVHVLAGPDKARPTSEVMPALAADNARPTHADGARPARAGEAPTYVGRTLLGPPNSAESTLSGPPNRLLIQFASTQAAIDSQVDQLHALIDAEAFDLVTDDAERDLWQGHMRGVWAAPGVIVRASWLPASLAAVLALLNEIAGRGADAIEIAGRAGVGAGIIRIDGDLASSVAALERLRAKPDVLGHVVLLRAGPDVKQQIDVWGPPNDHPALLAAVKHAFDPAGILNAGRGPI
jgi:glycolate oxidase FAD binding subunit